VSAVQAAGRVHADQAGALKESITCLGGFQIQCQSHVLKYMFLGQIPALSMSLKIRTTSIEWPFWGLAQEENKGEQ